MQDDELRATGRLRLSPGTLYSAVKRMLECGLIEEGTGTGFEPFDTRRYYRITAFGRRVAQAEADRLMALLDLARARNLIEA